MAAENAISQIQIGNVTYNLVDVTAVDRVAQVMCKGPIELNWTSDFYSYANNSAHNACYCIWGPLTHIRGEASPTTDIPADAHRIIAVLPEEATNPFCTPVQIQQGSSINTWVSRVYSPSDNNANYASTFTFERYHSTQSNIAAANSWLPFQITFMNERFFN